MLNDQFERRSRLLLKSEFQAHSSNTPDRINEQPVHNKLSKYKSSSINRGYRGEEIKRYCKKSVGFQLDRERELSSALEELGLRPCLLAQRRGSDSHHSFPEP